MNNFPLQEDSCVALDICTGFGVVLRMAGLNSCFARLSLSRASVSRARLQLDPL